MSDDQFTKLSDQIANLDELITKLYQHTESESSELRKQMGQRFAEVHDRLDQVYDLVDEDLKHRETDEHERLATNHQLDRHERWITKTAKQLGVSYER